MAMDEDDIKALEDAAEAFQEATKYSQELKSNVSETGPAFQQLNQYSKDMRESVQAIEKSVGSFVDALSKTGMIDNLRAATNSTQDLINKERELRIANLETAIQERENWAETSKNLALKNKALEAQRGLFRELGDAMAASQQVMARAGYDIDPQTQQARARPGPGGTLARGASRAMSTGSEVLFGAENVEKSLGQIKNSIASLIPAAGGIGGLFGLIIAGVMKEAEFRAVGDIAKQQFDTMGGQIEGLGSRIGSASRVLSVAGMAAKEDLAKVAAGFAETGVKAKEATVEIENFTGITGLGLMEASLAADKAFELAAGTMAKLSGTLARDFNMAADEAFIKLTNIGVAAKEAGMNAATFMHQVMETTSAVRMLNANTGGVMSAQLGMARGMMGAGYSSSFSQAYAAGGMKSAVNAAAGLDVGLSAIIGEQIDPSRSGLDAWYALKSPMGRRGAGDKMDPMDVISKLGDMVKGMTGERSEQVYALTKLTGTDVAGAEAILRANEEMAENGKLSAATQKELNGAFKSEAQKTSEILRAVEQIKDGLLMVGVGLLQLIIAGITSLTNAVMGGFYAVMAKLDLDSDRSAAYQGLSDVYFEKMGDNARGADAGLKATRAGALKAYGGASSLFDQFVRGSWDGEDPEVAVARDNLMKAYHSKIGIIDAKPGATRSAVKAIKDSIPLAPVVEQVVGGAELVTDFMKYIYATSQTGQQTATINVKQNGDERQSKPGGK